MELFFYTLLYITVGVAYFYVAVVSGNAIQLVGIDSRVYLGARSHILFKYVGLFSPFQFSFALCSSE